ncbi:MAG: hypothetical protein M3071_19800 [Actinomycetota bacterium]|nr:hypothetical protein [Actinomycetota bacterium]
MTEMNSDSNTRHLEPPAACTLDAGDGPARMRRWQALADKGRPIAKRRGHRLEVRYEAEPGVREELEALAAAERHCCKFVAWEVIQDGRNPVLLVTADPSTPEGVAPIAALLAADESRRLEPRL